MSWLQRTVLAARVLLGLVFFIPGIILLLKPEVFPASTPQATQFIAALKASHLFSVAMAIEAVCGVLLILGFFVPLVLTVLAPILVNIVLFQLIQNPGPIGWALGFGPLVLELGLAYAYREAFLELFHIRPEPF
jgi:putative oxidoreductase